MSKIARHLKSNAIAYAALFIALGGTSYAAVNLPAGSVGTRQLRNGAVTPSKLSAKNFSGSVALWAQIEAGGRLIAAKPTATVTAFAAPGFERVTWRRSVSSRCFAIANATNVGPIAAEASANATGPYVQRHTTSFVISTFSGNNPTPEPVNVVVICP
jgi:hypothetical protein